MRGALQANGRKQHRGSAQERGTFRMLSAGQTTVTGAATSAIVSVGGNVDMVGVSASLSSRTFHAGSSGETTLTSTGGSVILAVEKADGLMSLQGIQRALP